MSFFGAVVVGHPAVLEFKQDSSAEGKWFAQLPFVKAMPVNSIVNVTCFLTQPLPTETHGTEIFANTDGQNWISIGYISNEKPSTVIQVKLECAAETVDTMALGVQVAQLSDLRFRFPETTLQDRVQRAEKVATKVVTHLQNFVNGFVLDASTIGQHIQSGNCTMSEEFVPMRCFQKWLNSLTRKLKNDPDFK